MMISPEAFIEEYRDKSYGELLEVRNELFYEICDYEVNGGKDEELVRFPSPETMYRMNLEYFTKLCELIYEKYDQEHTCHEDDE